jgi:cytochrome c6
MRPLTTISVLGGIAAIPCFIVLTAMTATQHAYAADGDAKTERAWRANCASCHGKDGKGQTEQGKKMVAGDMTTTEWQKRFTDEQMKKSITDGFKRETGGVVQEMKPFKAKLKPEEIDALVTYVRGFAKAP